MGLQDQGRTPTRTTCLEAVNVLLTNIGEQPIDTNEGEQIQDARIAEATLLEFHKEGQVRGWSWNQEEDYPFAKDLATGEVVVPENVARFTVNPYRYDGRFIVRGQRVYDLQERSFKLPADVTEVCANVTWLLSWDDSPEAYNRWTTIRAARVFCTRVLGSDSLTKLTAYDESAALTELMRVEIDQSQPNSLTGGFHPFPTYRSGIGLARGVLWGTAIG